MSSSLADWAAGIESHSRALLSEGKVADGLHREAIDGSAVPDFVLSWPAPICSTASGCAERTAA
jgi:hypothetical protein